jgi:hypothetical protein
VEEQSIRVGTGERSGRQRTEASCLREQWGASEADSGVVWHSIEVVNPWRRGSDPPFRTWRGVLEALEQDCSLQVETGKAVSGPDPTCQRLRTQLHTSLCEITLAIVNFVIKYISNLFPNVTPREDG